MKLSREDVQKHLQLATKACAMIISSGGEVYRGEDTAVRILSTFSEYSDISAYATPGLILVSLAYKGEKFTDMLRIRFIQTDLGRLEKVNMISREFTQKNISVSQAHFALDAIKMPTEESKVKKILAGSLACTFSCLLFGGNALDGLSTFIITVLVLILSEPLKEFSPSYFLRNFFGALLIGGFALLLKRTILIENVDLVIIGSIMHLVPGVAITNAIRDIISGEFQSGNARFLEAVFTALAIAIGLGITLPWIS